MDLQGVHIAVRTTTPNRLILTLFVAGTLAATLLAPSRASAQEDTDAPLGDIARSFRKKPVPSQTVINVDDDNLSKVMDDAESRRASGASPVFSFDPVAKGFHVSSPEVTCSLSFTAKTSSLSDPLLLDDLPRAELAKLDGPATIDGDSLQVSMHNGTSWDLREVVIGLTIVKRADPADAAPNLGQLRIVPAAASGFPQVQDSFQKQPDVTMLLHVKGAAAPSTTATFRTALNFALFPDQEWHWAIVRAKGIPPQAPPEVMTMMKSEAATQPAAPPAADSKAALPSPPNKTPASPDAPPH
jgi:hypothetical protein